MFDFKDAFFFSKVKEKKKNPLESYIIFKKLRYCPSFCTLQAMCQADTTGSEEKRFKLKQ